MNKPAKQKGPGKVYLLFPLALILASLSIYLSLSEPGSPQSKGVTHQAPKIREESTFPATLSPALFTGKTARAYKAAQEIPQVLSKIFCYCGCDLSAGHKNNLDCFRDEHASG